MKDEGILDGRLISHVWRRFKPDEQLQLLAIMEHFDLICVASDETTRIEVDCSGMETETFAVPTNYYVPSLFNPRNVKEESDLASSTAVTFFVDFSGLFTSKICDYDIYFSQ